MHRALGSVTTFALAGSLALTACPSASAPVAPREPPPAEVAPVPLLVAPLFDRLASTRYAWTLDLPARGDEPAVHYTSIVGCSTAEPIHLGAFTTATWTCFEDLDTPPPYPVAALGQTWLASPDGLWKVDAAPATAAAAAALANAPPFLAAAPTRLESATATTATTVRQETVGEGIAWCRRDATLAGDQSDEVCVEPGRGIAERRLVGRLGPGSVERLVLVAPDRRGPP